MKNRFLTYIVSISIIFSCCSFMNITTVSAAYGNCGDNVYWSLDNSGTLIISGTGDMYDFSSFETPWNMEETNIKKVIIEDGVTRIGNWSFSQFQSLSELVIGNGVTSIGIGAFCQCDSLTTINIPYGVKTIERYAFQQSDKLRTIVIPDSVNDVGEQLFYQCPELTDVVVGNGITAISSKMFDECTKLTNISLPQTLTTIGDYAFLDCYSLSEISIPNSVSSIGGWAFGNCYNLKTLKLPESTKALSGQTFKNCTALSKIYIPQTLKSIQFETFDNCTSLTEIYYGGDKSMWKDVFVGSHNAAIKDATLHYNSTDIIDEITVILNGEKIIFDQPPVMQNDRILVPIRKIAESMGKTVLWSEKTATAFIDNNESALIIPIGQNTIYIGDENGCDDWARIPLDVVAQTINGRTLVPLRAFCESLGSDVKWDGNSNTAYISSDNIGGEQMSDEMFDAINLNYYIMRCYSNPFDDYNLSINDFYDNRNQTVDAVAMGLSNVWSGVEDLISMTYGSNNATNIISETLYNVLSETRDDTSYSVNLKIAKTIKSYVSNGAKIYSETGGFAKSITDSNKALNSLNKSILSFDKNYRSSLGDIFDYSVFGINEMAYILSDYSNNVAYLDTMRDALEKSGCLDDTLKNAIDMLAIKYTDTFAQTLIDLSNKIVVEKELTGAISSMTGGAFGLGKFVWQEIFKLTGVTGKGSALKSFYGIYCYNAQLDVALMDSINNSRRNPDLMQVKNLLEIERASKKVAFKNMKEITNKKDSKNYADEIIKELDDFTYYSWSRK